ncbi:MAG: copper ion binding protein [Bacteroidota bacterium]
MTRDPVCGMEISSPSSFQSIHDGHKYEFCSQACKDKFDANPDHYIISPSGSQPTYRKHADGTEKMQVPIIGMDCPSCALSIEKEVKKLPGVKRINVNVTTGNAFVEFDPSTVRTTEIIDAIKSAGYRTGKATLRLGIKGMYCASCVTKIEDELRRTPGVLSADVNLATESATIEYLSSNIKISDVKKVIYSLGYEVIEPEGRSVPPTG